METPEKKKKKMSARTWGLFWLVGLGVFLFRLWYVLAYPETLYMPDSEKYLEPVLLWGQGLPAEFHFLITPGYPAFLMVVSHLSGLVYLPLVQHLILVACLMLAAWVLIRLFPSRPGLFAACFFLLYTGFCPSQFLFASHMLTEGLETPFLLVAIFFFFLVTTKKKIPYLFVFCLWLAAGLYLRSANLSLVFSAIIALAVLYRKKSFGPILVLLLTIFITQIPWQIHNKRKYGHYPHSTASASMLTGTYAHLILIETEQNKKYKQAIAQAHAQYLAERENLSQEVLVTRAGHLNKARIALTRQVLMPRFHLSIHEALAVSRSLVVEGMAKHPEKVIGLIMRKLAFFYTYAPSRAERLYESVEDIWAKGEPGPWARDFYTRSLSGLGFYSLEKSPRQERYQKAGLPPVFVHDLTGVFSFLAPMCLWLSIALFPAVFFSRHRAMGVFLFCTTHLSALMVCVSAHPGARYYQPLGVLAVFLLVMEILLLAERLQRKKTWEKDTAT